MIRSHYIPQFILRNFCENDTITYCDLDKNKTELRNTRSVFSEYGYYPDATERELSLKAEHQFANLFHNKIEKATGNIILTSDELFILKKFLLVSAIRYRRIQSEEDKERAKEIGTAFIVDHDKDLNSVLDCESAEKMIDCMRIVDDKLEDFDKWDEMLDNKELSIPLWSQIKDVMGSYVVFLRTMGDEEFLISDIGRGIYMGPMSQRKSWGLLEIAMTQHRGELFPILQKLTPHDYTVFPLTKNLAILSISPFFKLLTDSEYHCNVILPDDCSTVSKVLGFGDRNTITPPKVRIRMGIKEFRYEIKRIQPADVVHLNCLMVAEAEHHIAYSREEHIAKTKAVMSEFDERYKYLEQFVYKKK